MKWLDIQPFSGGMSIATEEFFGKPKYILSDSKYKDKDRFILNYWDWEKVYLMDKDEHLGLDYKDIDLVVSMMPCNGLSFLSKSYTIGDKNKWGTNSETSINIQYILNFVLDKVDPEYFIFENAPQLLKKSGKEIKKAIIEICKKYNRSVTFLRDSPHFHGIPQKRERIFIFITRKNSLIFPFYNKPLENINNFIKGPKSTLEKKVFSSPKDFYTYFYIKDKLGKNFRKDIGTRTVFKYLIKHSLFKDCYEYLQDNKFEQKYIENLKKNWDRYEETKKNVLWDNSLRFWGDCFGPVVWKNCYYTLHNTEDRMYSVREFLRLMGFPENYTMDKDFKKLTNSVQINSFKDYLHSIFISGIKESNENLLIQDNYKKTCEPIQSSYNYFF